MKKNIYIAAILIVIILIAFYLFNEKFKQKNEEVVVPAKVTENKIPTTIPNKDTIVPAASTKSKTPTTTSNEISESDKSTIISTYGKISKLVSDGPFNNAADVELMIPIIENYPDVEKVWFDGSNSTLFVKFKAGGTISYSMYTPIIKQPFE